MRGWGLLGRAALPQFADDALATADVVGLAAEGAGSIAFVDGGGIINDLLPYPEACIRGGYPALTRGAYDLGVQVLHSSPGAPTDLIIRASVPAGLAGVPAQLVVGTSSPAADTGAEATGDADRTRDLVVTLPRTGLPERHVTLRTVRYGPRAVRMTGQLTPPTPGTRIEFAGRRVRDIYNMNGFGSTAWALSPIGERMRQYGVATTDQDGRFVAWVDAPAFALVVARTGLEAGVAAAGASCPVAVPARSTQAAIERGRARRHLRTPSSPAPAVR